MLPKRIERYIWRTLLVVPLVGVLIAVKGLLTGAPTNPALVGALTGLDWQQLRMQEPGVAQLVSALKRHESLALLGWAFWLAWTNIHVDRFSSRWVWYGWWSVPMLIVGFILAGAGVGGKLRWMLLAVTVFTIAGLLLCRRWLLGTENRST
jgi:hypothetical protein